MLPSQHIRIAQQSLHERLLYDAKFPQKDAEIIRLEDIMQHLQKDFEVPIDR